MSAEGRVDDGVEATMRHAGAAVREGNMIFSRLQPLGARESIGGMLSRNGERFAGLPAFRERRGGALRTITWDALLSDVEAFARFLSMRGVRAGDRVAVISPNRGEMLVAEFATMGLGAIYTPIFSGYAAEQLRFLVTHAEPVALLLASPSQLPHLGVLPSVRVVVTFEAGAMEPVANASGAPAVWYSDAIREGTSDAGARRDIQEWLGEASAVDPDSPALMMYTSGTDRKSVV